MLAAALLLTAGDTATGLDIGPWGQLGAAGLIFATLVAVGRAVYARETKRADAAEAEVRRLNALILERLVPMMEKSTEAWSRTERSLLEVLAETRARHR